MIIDNIRDYVVDSASAETVMRRIESAEHVKLMHNNLMTRTVYKIPSTNKGNNWLRARLGDTTQDGAVYASLTYKNMIPFESKQNLERSIEVRIDDYDSMVELLDASGFERASTQENLRTKYMMTHSDSNVSFEITIDIWPQLDKRFIQIKPERIIPLNLWDEIEEFLELQHAKVESNSVNNSYLYKFGKSSLDISYIGFHRFDTKSKIHTGKKTKNATSYHSLFLYITEKCQLKCKHCFMGSRLTTPNEMTKQYALVVAQTFKKLGTKEITIIGGEPTLHPQFQEIANEIIELGFDKVIIDTNGLQVDNILALDPQKIDHIKVSLDSCDRTFHNNIRGTNTFERTIENIRKLVKANFRVCINCTLFADNIESIADIQRYCLDLGATMLNFHSFSPIGMGSNISDQVPTPEQMNNAYHIIQNNISPIEVTFPRTWIKHDEYRKITEAGYHGCIGLNLERFSVFPDGSAYICTIAADTEDPFMIIEQDGHITISANSEYQLFLNSSAQNPYLPCPLEQCGDDFIPICKCWKDPTI